MKKKVLTVCIGGTVRSVGLKDYLNGNCRCDALAASAIWQGPETMRILCDWADLIVPVEPRDLPKGPEQYKDRWAASPMWDAKYDGKRHVFDIGPDVWGNAREGQLQGLIASRIKELPL